ncbi:hypothetical protein KSP39_PZI019050 [Platanthera zijinensis]|uniref:Uncharacterized protein n=1 Tax=Platanthera zijinensis TaxID=2320716 RepID=A0AAP0B0V8_9ASPA
MPSHFSPFLLPAFFFQRSELHWIPPTSHHLYTRQFGEVHNEEGNSSEPPAEVSKLASPYKLEPTKFHVRRSRDRHQHGANERSSSPTDINFKLQVRQSVAHRNPLYSPTLTPKCNEKRPVSLDS